MKKSVYLPLLALISSMSFMSCDSNDDMMMENEEKTSTISVENIVPVKDLVQSGTFKGAGTPPIILPGQSVTIKFNAGKGQHLAFATMYGNSKDWFFAPSNPGLKLYLDNGQPITGDVSSQIKLWDNGSKNDVTGATETNNIKEVSGINASSLMNLSLDYDIERSEFTLTIKNISNGTMHETPFSPGVWAVSNILGGKLLNPNPFFEEGKLTNAEITPLAEMGNNELLAKKAEMNTGVITGLSPVLVVVYNGIQNPIFKTGINDSGNGLKEIAQRGDASKLSSYLKNLKGVKDVYILGNSPIGPGGKVTGSIKGKKGDKVGFVTMFGYSNDWFYANSEELVIDEKADIVSKTGLYDNGTAKDQFLGAGNAQAIFEGKPILENKTIEKVGNAFPFPANEKVLL
ncbi:spondin domain-containing protein [Empedobacter falsenii]